MYLAQLEKLAAELEKKLPKQPKVYFHHDNARPHISKSVKEQLAQFGWDVIPQPPYSPDIAPSYYHLFRSLSNDLRGKKFEDENDLKS